jgi:hypothetical protein
VEEGESMNDIDTVEAAIHAVAQRMTSDFFLQYVRERVNKEMNMKCILKIKRSSKSTGYAVSFEHITESQEKTFGVLTRLK